MALIEYETPSGTAAVQRDVWHTEQDPLLTAYDTIDEKGVKNKIHIPLARVIYIDD